MSPPATDRPQAIIWDFDGTLLPFDSEQALLLSLSREPKHYMGQVKARWGRWLAWADRHGYLARSFKRWYARCLRGLSVEALDAVAREAAQSISEGDRQAVRQMKEMDIPMVVVSCGTGDLGQRILLAAGLGDCFQDIEANWFTYWEHRIEGLDLVIHMPEDKLAAIRRLGIDLGQAMAIGDGLTDVPVLDRARYPILIDRTGKRADLIAAKGYHAARSLAQVSRLAQEIVGSDEKKAWGGKE